MALSSIVYQEEDYIELCNEKISDENLQLKLEDPIEYYLKNIEDPEIMAELRWEDPYFYDYLLRLHFINEMQNHENIYRCPECRGNIITDIDSGEEYCTCCGLVTRTHYPYVAGQRLMLDYGLK